MMTTSLGVHVDASALLLLRMMQEQSRKEKRRGGKDDILGQRFRFSGPKTRSLGFRFQGFGLQGTISCRGSQLEGIPRRRFRA